MTAALAPRAYTLRLSRLGDRVSASVDAKGPAQPLHIGRGRTIAECVRFAGLLFPVCPRAHQAAFLNAVEAALCIQLSSPQARAREAAVLAEAVAAGVWREGLCWPSLFGGAPDATVVRAAREASDDVLRAIFSDDDWARLGGAEIKVDRARLDRAARRLAECVAELSDAAGRMSAEAGAWPIVVDHGEVSPLGSNIWRTDILNDDGAFEETPRALRAGRGEASSPISAWYLAQRRHLEELVASLTDVAEELCDEASAPTGAVAPSLAPGVDVNAEGLGWGVGVAMTARGRLRHAVKVTGGRVADWLATAPTDWNFAPRGPLARAAARLPAGRMLKTDARRLVGAFDPCAPCEIVMESARA